MNINSSVYIFILVTVILDFMMFGIWSKGSYLNVFIKLLFLSLGAIGIILLFILYPVYF